MKAEELRIGNFLKSKRDFRTTNQEDKLGCIIVSSIERDSINKWQDMGASDSLRFDDLESIQITEEWLLRLGFEKESDVKFFKGNFYIFKTDKGNWVMAEWDTYKFIQYVHELQNLYFTLKGEELYFKL